MTTVHAQHCTFITQRVQCKELSCNQTTGHCIPCVVDSDCYEGAYGCFSGSCKLKPLSETFTSRTLLAPLVGFSVCAIAVLAGVGGGAILVPLFIAILQIPMSDAVGLSQATICGQSILNVILQVRRHHPDHSPPKATRPVINYEYCNLLLPIALCGTLLGSMGNKVSPDWLRVVLLITLFTYVLFRLIQRILHQRARDREAKLVAERQREDSDDVEKILEINKTVNSPLLSPEKVEEKPQHPIRWQLWTAFVFGVFFAISYVKQNVVECGSYWYIVVVAGSFVVGCSLTGFVRLHLGSLLRKIVAGEAEACVVPFKWNVLTTIVFPLICVVAGFAASMLGIGGGLVFSSLLLEAGLTPEAASATGGLATLLVAVQSAADFVLVNELRYDYGLMMFGSGVLSTLFGQFVLMREIRRRGLTYLIVLALALIMGGSMLAVTIYGIINTVQIEENNGSLGFGPLCGN
eukprot:CAMPEP_0176462162 /NCGR_PEP_ID=MMETSP0127-20121128/35098_1 /TAXON_ID=938130 /ORGANISM="Platyophrya macrostoma, Strain WH" /LENGTH=463 /DNA_ID=CAMNT_0017854017 /DNA_START=195 /DNA_END=1586 /DNA_ORIENTATION=+